LLSPGAFGRQAGDFDLTACRLRPTNRAEVALIYARFVSGQAWKYTVVFRYVVFEIRTGIPLLAEMFSDAKIMFFDLVTRKISCRENLFSLAQELFCCEIKINCSERKKIMWQGKKYVLSLH